MAASEITISVNLNFNISMWDCLKMRIIGFTKDQILEVLDRKMKENYRRTLLENINDGMLTTKCIVDELATREGVEEIWIDPHEEFSISKGSTLWHKSEGAARILVVTD